MKTMLHEQQNEVDVGITEYISDLEGFSGIIKARYSDFHVNEIDLENKVAKFSEAKVPNEFKEVQVDMNNVLSMSSPLPIIPEDSWKDILKLFDKPPQLKVAELNVTNATKEERTTVHQTIRKVFGNKLHSNTTTKGTEKFVQLKLADRKDHAQDRIQWPGNLGTYVHFVVHKEQMDTLEATYLIADALKMKPAFFTYAGVKDKRAKTSQWFCVRKVDPKKLLNRTRKIKRLYVGNITFKTDSLKLGQLKGNQFRIALRNVTGNDELISKAMTSLKENGFINYYGLQRFGNDKSVPTPLIGVQLMLGNWKEACDLILKLKKGDDPHSDITKAKKIFAETKDPSKAINALFKNKNKCVESKLLQGFSKNGLTDYVNALESIPRNMRLLYIHSFQSLVWNKVVSKRIKDFGLKPIVGDLVLKEAITEPIIEGEDVDTNALIEDEKPNEAEAESPAMDVSEENDKTNGKEGRQDVKVLTEEDLDKYNIFDVVLPLPGYDIIYPENTLKDYYKEILEEYGLSLEMPKQKVKTYTLSGAYRKIIASVDNLSWKIMRYNNPTDNLIRSDFEEFRGQPEPSDAPDGKYKALVMDFCLSSSCYATMALREVLKMDTSSQKHYQLNNYHKPSDNQNIQLNKTEEQSTSLKRSGEPTESVESKKLKPETANLLSSTT